MGTFYVSDEIGEVEFDGDIRKEDDSFSYSYGSIDAVQRYEPYYIVEVIEWDKQLYTDKENEVIAKYVKDNYSEIEKSIIDRI